MRLGIGLPGEHRQDPDMSSAVKTEHQLGGDAGRWIKQLYPPDALKEVKALDNKARALHDLLTLKWDTGIGILPAGLIAEYGDQIRQFKGEREVLVEKFLAHPEVFIEWAIAQHNGTFDPDQYPGCGKIENQVDPVGRKVIGDYFLDVGEWQNRMRKKFYFGAEPLPVPAGTHYTDTIAALLGTDVESTDRRVREAQVQAQQELLERLLAPVIAMARKLAEKPKEKKNGKTAEDIVFRDSLVGNIREIANLAPKLNLAGDAKLDQLIAEVERLSAVDPGTLRDNKGVRSEVQKQADELAKRLAAYSF